MLYVIVIDDNLELDQIIFGLLFLADFRAFWPGSEQAEVRGAGNRYH